MGFVASQPQQNFKMQAMWQSVSSGSSAGSFSREMMSPGSVVIPPPSVDWSALCSSPVMGHGSSRKTL